VGQAFAQNDDDEWMRFALLEAAAGLGYVEPNPLVGAIVVRNGTLAGAGHHARFGGPHAEVVALAAAGEQARDSTLYVTLEPCCHFGKTPPCTNAIIAAGVSRVVVAMPDPYPEVNGKGISILRDSGRRRLQRPAGARSECPVSQARHHWLALRHRQVGHDPRRQNGCRVG
jgi:diaminohydroxyphosphoribosylaminopyrimidine deaminase / 5-amino-6-(5-phosphoribosylamino)uracil reductase